MNTTHPPVGPTEQDVRAHFDKHLPADVQLMRPAYTSIWALEDGTLLWDWKEGYATLGSELKCIIYLTGPQGSGKSTLVSLMSNAIEIQAPKSGIDYETIIAANVDVECIVFTAQKFSRAEFYHLQEINKGLKLIWLTAE
jgi:Cdc6-like AAA superfamily ATPase